MMETKQEQKNRIKEEKREYKITKCLIKEEKRQEKNRIKEEKIEYKVAKNRIMAEYSAARSAIYNSPAGYRLGQVEHDLIVAKRVCEPNPAMYSRDYNYLRHAEENAEYERSKLAPEFARAKAKMERDLLSLGDSPK